MQYIYTYIGNVYPFFHPPGRNFISNFPRGGGRQAKGVANVGVQLKFSRTHFAIWQIEMKLN